MKNRIISMVCVLAMVLSCVSPMFVLAETEENDATVVANPLLLDLPLDPAMVIPASGTLVYEMENATDINKEVASIATNENASGGKYLQITADAHDKNTPLPEAPYEAKVSFSCEEAGSYLVWIRSSQTTSCWKSFNGGTYNYWSGSAGNADGSGWSWSRLGRVTVTEGVLEVRFYHRYKNVSIDKIVITKDVSYNPFSVDDMPPYDTTRFYDIPSVKPPEGHPRIYVTKENRERLIEKSKTEYFKDVVAAQKKSGDNLTMEKATRGGIGTVDSNVHTYLRARSFAYILDGADDDYGRETIKMMRKYLETVDWQGNGSNIARPMGDALWAAAIVYDYHHHLLTEDDKVFIIARMKYFLNKLECGYPISQSLGKLYGHTNEYMIFRDMLSVGAAIYDEDPEVWNIAAGCFFQHIVPGRHWQSQSGVHGSGIMYGAGIRIMAETYAMMLFLPWGLTEDQLFSENWKDITAKFLYMRLPDGYLIADGENGPRTGFPSYETIDNIPYMVYLFPNSKYNSLFRGEQIKDGLANGRTTSADIWQLLFWETDDYHEFDLGGDAPLAYLGGFPFTHVAARTGWNMGIDSPDAVVLMKGRNYSVENHMKPDNGHFELYYKGPLAAETASMSGASGFLSSYGDRQYERRTISHNCITVIDPEEVFSNTFYANGRDTIIFTNDGGQDLEIIYNSKSAPTLEKALELCGPMAITEGKYAGPNADTPKFTYLKSDLTKSYAGRRVHKESGRTLRQVLREDYGYKVEAEEVIKQSHFYPSYKEDYYVVPKLSDYKRSMVFMDLNNKDYPAALIVFDKVTSTNKDFDKNWLLHSTDGMTVDGNITTITNTSATNEFDVYNGKLVNYTFLPENAVYDVIGGDGKEAWVEGTNWTGPKPKDYNRKSTNYRLELSPSVPSENDLFLNAMYVTDYDRNLPQLPMYREDAVTHVGVTVMDRVVMFARDGKSVAGPFNMDIRDNNNGGLMSCMITDVAPGKWTVVGGGKKRVVEVTEEENTLYFEGLPGQYTFTPAGANAKAEKIEYPKLPKVPLGDFLIYGVTDEFYRYNPAPPKLIDGEPFVAAEGFYSYYKGGSVKQNADGSYSLTTLIDYGNNIRMFKEAVFWVGKKEAIINGEKITIKNAPRMIDGLLYVDPRDFVGATCLEIDWKLEQRALRVTDNTPIEELFERLGCQYRNVLKYKVSDYSSYHDKNAPKGMGDLNMDTRWTSTSSDGPEWVILDFGEVYDLNAVYFSQYYGDHRKQHFSVDVSADGENWREVYRGESSGLTEDIQRFDLKDADGARYLRFNALGNNLNNFNSINELWVERKR